MSEYIITQELEEEIKNASSIDDVIRICAERGLDISKAQLEHEISLSSLGELREDDLDSISGGGFFRNVISRIASICSTSAGGGKGAFGRGGKAGGR